jgi:hypothetical protein
VLKTPAYATMSAGAALALTSIERREPGPREVRYRFVIDLASLRGD